MNLNMISCFNMVQVVKCPDLRYRLKAVGPQLFWRMLSSLQVPVNLYFPAFGANYRIPSLR